LGKKDEICHDNVEQVKFVAERIELQRAKPRLPAHPVTGASIATGFVVPIDAAQPMRSMSRQ